MMAERDTADLVQCGANGGVFCRSPVNRDPLLFSLSLYELKYPVETVR